MDEVLIFRDRTDAGRQLAGALGRYRASRPLVLALPRGGVVVGAEISRQLCCDLDVMLVKKLRAPGNPELAIGAIGEYDRVYLNEEVVRLTGTDDRYLEREQRERRAEIAAQQDRYRAVRPRVPVAGRTAILVDDGLATGASMIAAARATAGETPKALVVAVPVSPPDTLDTIRAMDEVADVICLSAPPWFAGVGQFYDDFSQISDDEVIAILRESAARGSR